MGILQNLQKFRVRVRRKCCRTHRSSGYCGTGVQKSQKFRAGIHVKMLYPYPGYLWHWRTEPTDVPGAGINVAQNLQKFRVRVYKTYIISLSGNTRGKYRGYGSVRTLQNTTLVPGIFYQIESYYTCLLYTSPSPRDRQKSRMPSSA